MATPQAFCSICQSKVSAHTILSDDDVRRSLDLGEDISARLRGPRRQFCWPHLAFEYSGKGEPPQVPKLGAGL